MPGDIDLSGFVFTRKEWQELDDDDRSELLQAAQLPIQPPPIPLAMAAEA